MDTSDNSWHPALYFAVQSFNNLGGPGSHKERNTHTHIHSSPSACSTPTDDSNGNLDALRDGTIFKHVSKADNLDEEGGLALQLARSTVHGSSFNAPGSTQERSAFVREARSIASLQLEQG